MRVEGIQAKSVKKSRATTQSNHRLPVVVNTRKRQVTVAHPNQMGPGDSTDGWTKEGWLYLAMIFDLHLRLVIGWTMGHLLTVKLAA